MKGGRNLAQTFRALYKSKLYQEGLVLAMQNGDQHYFRTFLNRLPVEQRVAFKLNAAENQGAIIRPMLSLALDLDNIVSNMQLRDNMFHQELHDIANVEDDDEYPFKLDDYLSYELSASNPQLIMLKELLPFHKACDYVEPTSAQGKVTALSVLSGINDCQISTVLHLIFNNVNDYPESFGTFDDFRMNDNACEIELPIFSAIERGPLNTAMLLLAHGASTEVYDDYGNTPLHYACKRQHLEKTCLLAYYGADSEATNNNGQTAFDLVADRRLRDKLEYHFYQQPRKCPRPAPR